MKPNEQNDDIIDSPLGWVNDHVREYVESDGRKGHQWRGLPTLLLTTRGRRTGLRRRTALIYGQDSEDYIIVASNGGSADHPLWYLNLVDEPAVELQVGSEVFTARAREASGDEKERLWHLMAGIFPTYDKYRVTAAKRGRDIPLIVLERES
jgi:deazaflavin-dependent oxidoreductase (nitroreductase family)